MGFDDRRDDVGPSFQSAVRLAEHRVRLADTGRRTQVDAQLAALGLVRRRPGRRRRKRLLGTRGCSLGRLVVAFRSSRKRLIAGAHSPIIHRITSAFRWILLVQFQVQLEDVHAGFAKEAEGARGLVVVDSSAHLLGSDAPGFGHPVHLQFGICH